MWRPRCEEHCIQCCCTHLAGSWRRAHCSASHDSSCCAYQMLITECVPSQPEACCPWPQKLIDTSSWMASEDLFAQWKNLYFVFLSTNLLVRSHSCVIFHIVSRENPCRVSDRPRKHWCMCCHCKRLDFVFDNCQICSSMSTYCGDGFLRCCIALMGLCRCYLSQNLSVLFFRTTFFCHFVQ